MEQLVRKPQNRELKLDELTGVMRRDELTLQPGPTCQLTLRVGPQGIAAPLKEGAAGTRQLELLLKATGKGEEAYLSIQEGANRYALFGSEIRDASLKAGWLKIKLAQPQYQITLQKYEELLLSNNQLKDQVKAAVRAGQVSLV
jgi:hypothetical protein